MRVSIIFYTIAFVFFFYVSNGVFLNYFRADEHYFMHAAWSIANRHTLASDYYFPGGFPYLLALGLEAYKGDMMFFYHFKLVLLSFVGVFIAASCWYFSKLFPKEKLFHLVGASLVTFSAVYLSAMRAFEVRPESLANVFLITSCVYIFTSVNFKRCKSALIISLLSSILASLLSARYVVPSGIIYLITVTLFYIDNKINLKSFLSLNLFMLFLAGLVLFVVSDFKSPLEILNNVLSGTSNVVVMPIADKLTVLGFGFYKYVIEMSVIEIYYRAIMLIYIVVLGTVSFFVVKSNKNKFLIVSMQICILLNFSFLIFVDKQPYSYAVTSEFILISLSSILIANMFMRDSKVLVSKTIVILSTIMVSLSTMASLNVLNFDRPSRVNMQPMEIPDAFKPNSYIDLISIKNSFDNRLSAFQQISLMNGYCHQIASYKAFVNNFSYHPVCIEDEYSIPYWQNKLEYSYIIDSITPNNDIVSDGEIIKIYTEKQQ